MTQQTAVIYSQHRCSSKHRSVKTFLRCSIRGLEWVTGKGSYALIAWCGVPTITLWETLSAATDAAEALTGIRCGGRCHNRHTVALINLEGQAK